MSIRETQLWIAAFAALLFNPGAAAAAPATAAAAVPARDLVVVLDASGSMLETVDAKPKIDVAREVLDGLVDGLPDTSNAGLIAYGHRQKSSCTDIQQLVAVGPIDKEAFEAKVHALAPKGKTPLTAATKQAIELAKKSQRPSTVVLITDGLETCGASPCDMVKEAKAAGIDFVLHVVGFDLKGADAAPLRCAAQAGGGEYIDAANASQLSAALVRTTTSVRVPTAMLTVDARANGEPIQADVRLRSSDGQSVFRLKVANPRGDVRVASFRVPTGEYEVRVTPKKRGLGRENLAKVTVSADKQVDKVVDFGSGTLKLTVTHNGAPMHKVPSFTVRRVGETRSVATRFTADRKASTPQTGFFQVDLLAGSYEIEVQTTEIAKAPKRTLKFDIAAGQVSPVSCDFESGTLSIATTSAGKPVSATLVYSRVDHVPGTSRTPANGDKAVLVLEPGTYKLRLSVPKLRKQQTAEVALAGGQIVDKTFEF